MMTADLPEFYATDQATAFGEETTSTSEKDFSSGSSGQWSAVDILSSSDGIAVHTSQTKGIDAYEKVPHNVKKDL